MTNDTMASDAEWQSRFERLEREHKQFRWYVAAAVLLVGMAPYVRHLWHPPAANHSNVSWLPPSSGVTRSDRRCERR